MSLKLCESCDGTGKIKRSSMCSFIPEIHICTNCNGKGVVDSCKVIEVSFENLEKRIQEHEDKFHTYSHNDEIQFEELNERSKNILMSKWKDKISELTQENEELKKKIKHLKNPCTYRTETKRCLLGFSSNQCNGCD